MLSLSGSTLFLSLYFHFCVGFVVPPKSFPNNSVPLPSMFISRWLMKSDLLLVSDPLVEDVDLDGNVDLFCSTMDGLLYGFLDVVKCANNKPCNIHQYSWPVSLHGEDFISSPITIDLHGNGPKSIVFTSYRGGIFIFDPFGSLITNFQIPDLKLQLPFLTATTLFMQNSINWLDKLQWAESKTDSSLAHDDVSNSRSKRDSKVIGFSPMFHSDPLLINSLDDDLWQSGALLYAVNFVSDRLWDNKTILLATLVSVPRCILLNMDCVLGLQILEFNWTTQFRPYISSTPVLITNPLAKQNRQIYSSTKPTPYFDWYTITTTFTGKIHMTRLPIKSTANGGGQLTLYMKEHQHQASTGIGSLLQSCVLIRCPSEAINARYKLTGFRSCCLLLDANSCLYFVIHSGFKADAISPIETIIRWKYCPEQIRPIHHTKFASSESPFQRLQISQIRLVPGCALSLSASLTPKNCAEWAMYSTPDGMVHSVDTITGKSVTNYPISLSHPFNDNHSAVNLTAGSGLLFYDNSQYIYWLFYVTTNAQLIYFNIHQPNPVVYATDMNLLSSSPPSPSSAREILELWLMPKLVNSQINQLSDVNNINDNIGNRKKLSQQFQLLIATTKGIVLLTPTKSDLLTNAYMPSIVKQADTKSGWRPRSGQLEYVPLISAEFFDRLNGKFIKKIQNIEHTQTVGFRIKDCSSSYNTFMTNQTGYAKQYLVRVVASFGLPVADWTPVTLNPARADHQILSSYCYESMNFIELIHLPIGPFRGYIYLSVVNVQTGHFVSLSTDRFISGSTDHCSEIILDIGAQWTQLIVGLAYLPGLYLIFGLAFLHIISTNPQIRSSCLTKQIHTA